MVELRHRTATVDDAALLANLNGQLLAEEGQQGVFLPGFGPPGEISLIRLKERMRNWISGLYEGVLFYSGGKPVAYALYQEDAYDVYVQQFFVVPEMRRRGVGRRCFQILRSEYWPRDKRLSLEVLAGNSVGRAFWHAMGYQEYSIELEIVPDEQR
jgi:GNAT superfamily N-acetyltransferase